MAKAYTKEQIADKVKEIISEYLPDIDINTIGDDTTLGNVDVFDSMTILLIITKLEAFYGIEIPDRKWRKLQTFGDVVEAVYAEL